MKKGLTMVHVPGRAHSTPASLTKSLIAKTSRRPELGVSPQQHWTAGGPEVAAARDSLNNFSLKNRLHSSITHFAGFKEIKR